MTFACFLLKSPNYYCLALHFGLRLNNPCSNSGSGLLAKHGRLRSVTQPGGSFAVRSSASVVEELSSLGGSGVFSTRGVLGNLQPALGGAVGE